MRHTSAHVPSIIATVSIETCPKGSDGIPGWVCGGDCAMAQIGKCRVTAVASKLEGPSMERGGLLGERSDSRLPPVGSGAVGLLLFLRCLEHAERVVHVAG